jgi:hypothetical protein
LIKYPTHDFRYSIELSIGNSNFTIAKSPMGVLPPSPYDANFSYDGDGNRVLSIVDGVATVQWSMGVREQGRGGDGEHGSADAREHGSVGAMVGDR